jgi:hypothetical protein
MNARARGVVEAIPTNVAGHVGRPNLDASGWRGAWRGLDDDTLAPGGGRRAKGVPQSNKRMHATADTTLVKLTQGFGAARDARRYAASLIIGNESAYLMRPR